jgi:hypothetical protein
MMRKFFFTLLAMAGWFLQTSPAPLYALKAESEVIVRVDIPIKSAPINPIAEADLDGNGTSEALNLTGGHLSIVTGSEPVWQSPETWQVSQAAFSDLNHDGTPEVTLLVWRPFLPWPVDQWLPSGGRIADFHNAKGLSCHIILIGWERGGYRELWAGSAMADPIYSLAVVDLFNNKKQVLVALEGRYSDPVSAPARTLKIWEWNGFGFSVVSSMNGKFGKMALIQDQSGDILILVP